jgi:hypothetical protein
LKTCAAARPSLSAVSAVTGSMLAVPRTPSVPKMRLVGRGGGGFVFLHTKLPGENLLRCCGLHGGGQGCDEGHRGAGGYVGVNRQFAGGLVAIMQTHVHMHVLIGHFLNE